MNLSMNKKKNIAGRGFLGIQVTQGRFIKGKKPPRGKKGAQSHSLKGRIPDKRLISV